MLPHLDAAYNLARWLLRHEHDAEDAVQDAFLRAHQAFGRFRGGDGRAWLLTSSATSATRASASSAAAPHPKPSTTRRTDRFRSRRGERDPAWHETKSALLRQALEQLPAEFREVIVLHELEGLAYREIAAVAEIPIGTARSAPPPAAPR